MRAAQVATAMRKKSYRKIEANADFLYIELVPMNSIRPLWPSLAGLTRGSIWSLGDGLPGQARQ